MLAPKKNDGRDFLRVRVALRREGQERALLAELRAALEHGAATRQGVWLEAEPAEGAALVERKQRLLARFGGERGYALGQLFLSLDSRLALTGLRSVMPTELLATYAYWASRLLPDPAERIAGAERFLSAVPDGAAHAYCETARAELGQKPALRAVLQKILGGGYPDGLAPLLEPYDRRARKLGRLLKAAEGGFEPEFPRPLTVFYTLLHFHFVRWDFHPSKERLFCALIAEASRNG